MSKFYGVTEGNATEYRYKAQSLVEDFLYEMIYEFYDEFIEPTVYDFIIRDDEFRKYVGMDIMDILVSCNNEDREKFEEFVAYIDKIAYESYAPSFIETILDIMDDKYHLQIKGYTVYDETDEDVALIKFDDDNVLVIVEEY